MLRRAAVAVERAGIVEVVEVGVEVGVEVVLGVEAEGMAVVVEGVGEEKGLRCPIGVEEFERELAIRSAHT